MGSTARSLLRSRLFLALLALFGLSDWADTRLDPDWHWHHITSEPFAEWVKQVPVQLPVRIAQGLKFPVDWAVSQLSAETMPWYARLFARTIGGDGALRAPPAVALGLGADGHVVRPLRALSRFVHAG